MSDAQTLEATPLRGRRYAVRPVGALGTCGWIGGVAWQVIYVTASNPQNAVRKAKVILHRTGRQA